MICLSKSEQAACFLAFSRSVKDEPFKKLFIAGKTSFETDYGDKQFTDTKGIPPGGCGAKFTS